MNKSQYDELYHLLRCVSNEAAAEKDPEPASAILGMTQHLLAGGDYLKLIQYSAYYGERFLLQPVSEAINNTGWEFDRVVEFGAGLGWVGRGLAGGYGMLPTMFVDKRHWSLIDIVADLETDDGINKVYDAMKADDLIVMSDFLHCVDNPKEILEHFKDWNMAVLEYHPIDPDYKDSYSTQLARYGGNPLGARMIGVLSTLGRRVDVVDLDPYVLALIDKEAK